MLGNGSLQTHVNIQQIFVYIKVRTSVFLKNFEKKLFFLDILIPFEKIFQENI